MRSDGQMGNWLEGSRLPIDKIVHFLYCWAFKLSSVKFCERELLMGHDAVVDFNNYCREVCAWKMSLDDKSMIGMSISQPAKYSLNLLT